MIDDPPQILIQVCMMYLKEEFRDDDVRMPNGIFETNIIGTAYTPSSSSGKGVR